MDPSQEKQESASNEHAPGLRYSPLLTSDTLKAVVSMTDLELDVFARAWYALCVATTVADRSIISMFKDNLLSICPSLQSAGYKNANVWCLLGFPHLAIDFSKDYSDATLPFEKIIQDIRSSASSMLALHEQTGSIFIQNGQSRDASTHKIRALVKNANDTRRKIAEERKIAYKAAYPSQPIEYNFILPIDITEIPVDNLPEKEVQAILADPEKLKRYKVTQDRWKLDDSIAYPYDVTTVIQLNLAKLSEVDRKAIHDATLESVFVNAECQQVTVSLIRLIVSDIKTKVHQSISLVFL